jgi:[ribosomal protein S5]-alanine N-acetyltransferase
MPELISPAIPAGRLCDRAQPSLPAGELTVRPWRASDVPRLVEAYQDEAIQRWHGRSMTEDEARQWVASWRERWAEETGADWAVTEHDVAIGRIGLRRLNLAEGIGEVAYWVLPVARGRAVATRSLTAVTAWMFGEIGLNRIELVHSTRNHSSCRVAAKTGYAYEGTMRRHALHADGWHDMHLHARLREEP